MYSIAQARPTAATERKFLAVPGREVAEEEKKCTAGGSLKAHFTTTTFQPAPFHHTV